MTATPAALCLPGGHVAPLVPGTRPARYEGTDVDVTIPDDLTGFYWHGSYLTNGRAVFFTADYGFPAIWDAARQTKIVQFVQLELFDIAA